MAAVFWLCEGSIIICLLNGGLNEWNYETLSL